MRMKPWHISAIAIAAFMLVLAEASLYAQSVKIVALKPPAYPPIALAARVTGKVHLKVALLENGTTGDIQIESGPPMLQQAALESAKGSRFEFDKNRATEKSYALTYQFTLEFSDCSTKPYRSPPGFSFNSDTVTVIGKAPMTCDPAAINVRSLKCLYLWKCGTK